jgi:hypothetical protein
MPILLKPLIREFVREYLQLSAEQQHTVVDYALDTWQPYQPNLSNLKYLHFIGGPATGKTRAGKIMEYICRNPLPFNAYASTQNSLAYLLHEEYPCTLILDDFQMSMLEEKDEDSKPTKSLLYNILRSGTMKNCFIMTKSGKTLKTFGYKVLFSTQRFQDMGLAARCIVVKLKSEPKYLDVSPLTDQFQDDGTSIRRMIRLYYGE